MLEIVGLTKIYGSKKAIDNISFDLHEGELCGFFGGNGAGKSTLIKIVTGIIGFDSGNVLLDGISVKDEPVEFKKNISYVPDIPFNKGIGTNFLGMPNGIVKSSIHIFLYIMSLVVGVCCSTQYFLH